MDCCSFTITVSNKLQYLFWVRLHTIGLGALLKLPQGAAGRAALDVTRDVHEGVGVGPPIENLMRIDRIWDLYNSA